MDKTVLKETGYIAAFVLIFSMLLESVFLIIGKWELPVLYGNLLGAAAAVGNFFLMGLTVQKAVQRDEKQAALSMKLSQMGRMLMLFFVALLAFLLKEHFNVIAVVIPFIFPRLAIALRPLFMKKSEK